MSFDELTAALVEHFASGASEWRVRQALSQRRQLDKEPVADYAYSLRTHCARLNLPKSEWTHYFVQGLKPDIREYVVLQQPESVEAAENFAKLKESVLASSEKPPVFDPRQMSSQIIEELSKVMSPKDKTIGAVGQQGSVDSNSAMRQVFREEFQRFVGNRAPSGSDRFRPRRDPTFQSRNFRSHSGDHVCYNFGKKGHLHYYCRENLTRGFRFRTMADKIMGPVNGVVKTITSGIPIRETK